jgi:hypothetical protein
VRPSADITNELIASGLSSGQTALLMELILTMSTGLSGRNPVESPEYRALEKRRAWDRDRQARKRAKAKANDPPSEESGGSPPESTGLSGGHVESSLTVEVKKDGLSKRKESKKGSRLLNDTRMSEEQRSAAIECGCPPDKVDAIWAEFVDYWSDIPGQKGCKLNWLGTWRNNVRRRFERGKNGNGFNGHRADPTTGRATAREVTHITRMGAAALQSLRESKSAGTGRETSRDSGFAQELDLGAGAKSGG